MNNNKKTNIDLAFDSEFIPKNIQRESTLKQCISYALKFLSKKSLFINRKKLYEMK